MEFDIKLKAQDMYRFNLYQTYTGFQGCFSIVVSVLIFVAAGVTYGSIEEMYTVLYVAFGLIFLFYMPVTLWLRSKHALVSSKALSSTLHYQIDDAGIHVSIGEESATLPWEQIYKMVATKSNVLIYSGRINAYVIPRGQIGGRYQELAALAEKKLPKYRVKMKKA